MANLVFKNQIGKIGNNHSGLIKSGCNFTPFPWDRGVPVKGKSLFFLQEYRAPE